METCSVRNTCSVSPQCSPALHPLMKHGLNAASAIIQASSTAMSARSLSSGTATYIPRRMRRSQPWAAQRDNSFAAVRRGSFSASDAFAGVTVPVDFRRTAASRRRESRPKPDKPCSIYLERCCSILVRIKALSVYFFKWARMARNWDAVLRKLLGVQRLPIE